MASSPARRTGTCAAVLLAAGPLLGVAAWSYPTRVQVSVCNQAGDLVLEDVRVAIVTRRAETPLQGLGSLGPGECRTTELEQPSGEGTVRLAYSAAGTRYDETEGYSQPGDHAWRMVRGPGQVEVDIEPPGLRHPPFVLMGLSILCFLAGGPCAFLACILLLEARLKREASG